jgi:hypothetical protein
MNWHDFGPEARTVSALPAYIEFAVHSRMSDSWWWSNVWMPDGEWPEGVR